MSNSSNASCAFIESLSAVNFSESSLRSSINLFMSFSTFNCSKSERFLSIIFWKLSLFFFISFMMFCILSSGISPNIFSISSINFFISSGMTSSNNLFISSCFLIISSEYISLSFMKLDSSFCSSCILSHSSCISFCFSMSSLIFSLSFQSNSFFDISSLSISSMSFLIF